MKFHSLKIIKIVSETSDAKTLYFEIPNDLKPSYHHLPGQYLTIKKELNGKEIRRAYSICSPPDSKEIGVTVKKVNKGLMSVYLNEKISVGDFLDIMTPEGHFVTKTDHNKSRDHYFFAAGSGITPIMSMVHTILEEEPKSVCHLLYGSRDEDAIIFKDKLNELSKKYEGQLYVEHVLSQPLMRKKGGIGGLFTKKTVDWNGKKGRIDEETCREFFSNHEPVNTEKQYYICGPGDFIERVETFLLSRQIDKKTINKEYFTSGNAETPSNQGFAKANVNVTLKGESIDIVVSKGKTILDVLVELKKDPPYSCTSGACSTCIAKVTEGTVSMDSCYALEDDEVAAGYILTCQSHPSSDKVVLTYDV